MENAPDGVAEPEDHVLAFLFFKHVAPVFHELHDTVPDFPVGAGDEGVAPAEAQCRIQRRESHQQQGYLPDRLGSVTENLVDVAPDDIEERQQHEEKRQERGDIHEIFCGTDNVFHKAKIEIFIIFAAEIKTLMEQYQKEDPLERLAREEREKKARGGSLRTVMIVLAVVAAALAAALAYVWLSKSKLVSDLELEKKDLTEQIVALQSDYDNLSSEYDAINSQLDSSREEVAQLVERIKKTDATNRAKMRQYEKELGTLRSIMRSYIVQIDSLNTLNHELTVQAAAARKQAEDAGRRNQELSAQVESLSGQVAVGSVIKGRNVVLQAYNQSDKVTDRSSRVVRMLVSVTLSENELAARGPVRVYVRVKDPQGYLLQDGTGANFVYNGEAMAATASREVDYTGQDVELSIYVNNIPEFTKGVYTAEVFTAQSRLGAAEVLLR